MTKLVEDEDHDLEMEIMAELGPRVIEDIGVEEGHDFIFKRWTIDFHQLRKLINKRCVNVVKRQMREQPA
ncbi:hypothetical protein ACFQL7_20760 [Halocatena marina]|uniref:Uncharacterized protein n=1 Tax=Halocatena marina TaxID=2934937 RepID=A0ABD5YHM9_9EURY